MLTYTREAPPGWTGHTGHVDAELLRDAGRGAALAFVCGSNGFVETASNLLLDLGMGPGSIRTERFGADKRLASSAMEDRNEAAREVMRSFDIGSRVGRRARSPHAARAARADPRPHRGVPARPTSTG